VLDALVSLVEQSLVRQSESADGEPRFRMLQTIREFAMEQAVANGRWDALRERHAALFAQLARDSRPQIMSSEKRGWLDRLEEEHDNLRAAIGWSLEVGAAEQALRMCADLWRFWQMRGHLGEGLERTAAALALPHGTEHPAARADALSAAAGLAYWRGDADRSRAFYREEIETRTSLGDRQGLAEARYGIAFTWAIIEMELAESFEQATSNISAALDIFTELGDRGGIGRCEWALANVTWGARDIDGALSHARKAYAVFEEIDDRFNRAWASYTIGEGLLSRFDRDGSDSDLAEATRYLVESLRLFDEAGDVSGYALVLDTLAIAAIRTGDRERAARISGAVTRLEQESGTGLNAWNRDILAFDPEELRLDPALADAWAEGEAFSREQAVAYALQA
jgi:tetratricopeptide (TPR) repeat protein